MGSTIDYLDYSLRGIRPGFDESVARRDAWLAYFFAPIRAADAEKLRKVAQERSERRAQMLRVLGEKHPGVVGTRLVKELASRNWPLEDRIAIAGALRSMYVHQVQEHPEWERALRAFYPAAIDSANAHQLSILAFVDFADRDGDVRSFRLNGAIEKSLRRALDRMREDLRKPKPDPETASAISVLEELLKQLKEKKKKK
jgi:hypothetical protein